MNTDQTKNKIAPETVTVLWHLYSILIPFAVHPRNFTHILSAFWASRAPASVATGVVTWSKVFL